MSRLLLDLIMPNVHPSIYLDFVSRQEPYVAQTKQELVVAPEFCDSIK